MSGCLQSAWWVGHSRAMGCGTGAKGRGRLAPVNVVGGVGAGAAMCGPWPVAAGSNQAGVRQRTVTATVQSVTDHTPLYLVYCCQSVQASKAKEEQKPKGPQTGGIGENQTILYHSFIFQIFYQNGVGAL